MFITEYHLIQFKTSSNIYRDLPLALIYYRELKRKDVFRKPFSFDIFRNFFHRYDEDFIEIQFPDASTLLIKLDEASCYVSYPRKMFFKQYPML
ncbi:Uncharacterised protein [Neisseria weaveri]|nr:Uncharacterised protein [Neisseria weaveri]